MFTLSRLLVAAAIFALIPLHGSQGHAAAPSRSFRLLSASEIREARHAGRLAERNPRGAVQWLRSQPDVLRVDFGSGSRIKQVEFRDHARYMVFPAIPGIARIGMRARVRGSTYTVGAAGPVARRAIVLEPFAGSDGVSSSAGQTEIDALTRSGFQVDVYRNGAVTIPLMETLTHYSVVYMETHSVADQTDGLVLTGDSNPNGYTQFCCFGVGDGSVQQGYPQNDPSVLYFGFNSKFITDHMGTFPPSAIVFLNGCSMLKAAHFWGALLAKGAGSVLSWDEEAQSADAEVAADFMFPRLATGETLGATLADAKAQHLDTSLVNGPSGPGHATLGLKGDAGNSFPSALSGDAPTPTPTSVASTGTPAPQASATPTATPTPSTPAALGVAISGGLKVNRNSTLRVSVTNRLTSRPVPGAKVSLDGRKVGLATVLMKTTGPKGQVVFKRVHPRKKGTMILKISKTGFPAEKRSFKVKG